MTIRRESLLVRAGLLLVFAILAISTLVPLWRAAGWPINHDNASGLRTALYAQHFAALDLLPIWSSADAHGFGSPMPLMYHKLFFMIAGLFAVAGAPLKTADVATLWLFLVAGALGLYRTVRTVGGGRLAAAIGGAALVTANYTVTNWLVRGAVAEFSGAMITASVLFYFVRSLQSGRLAVGLGVALGLLWLAHTVLAFYVGLLLAVVFLLLAAAGAAQWSLLQPRTAVRAVIPFVLLVGPYLAAMAVVPRGYDFTRILIPYQPENEFRPFLGYLWETTWHFGRTVSGFTVQLDHPVLVLLAIGLGAVVARFLTGTLDPGRSIIRPVLPLLLLAAAGLLLQLPAAAPFYRWVPGAAYLQFPWRLLALITPCLIAAAVCLADSVLPEQPRLFVLGGVAAWMISGSGAFAPLQDPRFILAPISIAGLTFSSPYREYEPRTAPPLAETEARLAARWTESGCSYQRVGDDETTIVRFDTVCGRAATLPLPLYASALHRVTVANGRRQPCLRLPDFPDLCGAAMPAAASSLAVEMPRLMSLLTRR